MKKAVSFLFALAMVLGLSACGGGGAPANVPTAEQVINFFAQEGMPIGNVVVCDEEMDPNNLLGRPGGYSSKVNFEDERTLGQYTDPFSGDYVPGNTLEVFDSESDAKARMEYMESVTSGTALVQYMYLEGTMLLRLDRVLLPSEAAEYEELLRRVKDSYDDVVAAPTVERVIGESLHVTVANDFARGTNLYQYDGLSVSIPAAWQDLGDGTMGPTMQYDPSGGDAANHSFCMIQFNEFESILNELDYEAAVEAMRDEYDEYSVLISKNQINEQGVGYIYVEISGTMTGIAMEIRFMLVDSDNGMMIISMVNKVGATIDYSEDFARMINSVSVTRPEEARNDGDSSGTEPDAGEESDSQPRQAETIEQRNAVSSANSYLDVMAFSRSGLIGQLEYEGYATEDAAYAVDKVNPDWNAQAAEMAQTYLDFMSFSRSGLIDQLKYEGFTQEQAEYGASAVGY